MTGLPTFKLIESDRQRHGIFCLAGAGPTPAAACAVGGRTVILLVGSRNESTLHEEKLP